MSAWDPTSGVLTVYRSLARHLGPRGVRFSAYAFDGWRDDSQWTFCDELIDGRTVDLARTLGSGRYDLIHCIDTAYSPPYGVEMWMRRARFRGPVVLMSQAVERVLDGAAHATRYVACSQAAAETLARDADGPVTVIPNGYDESIFRPAQVDAPARPELVWVGRSDDPVKDADLFLDAVAGLPAYDATLVDGSRSPRALPRLDELAPRVTYHSRLEPHELATVYRRAAASAGAFVSTSSQEGFNIAAVEAMACGCPAIVPRIPGHAHLIDVAGAVPYDRTLGAGGIAAALEQLRDPASRRHAVDTSLRVARQRWTSVAMAEQYLRLYEEALAEPTRGGGVRDAVARSAWRLTLLARPGVTRARGLLRLVA